MVTAVRSLSHKRRLSTYTEKVLSYEPFTYWPLKEVAGTTARCLVNPAYNAAYSGVTLDNTIGPDGENNVPLFDGVNDVIALPVAALDVPFDGSLGTMMIWARVNVGVWTDSTQRCAFGLGSGGANEIQLARPTTANQFRADYEAGSVIESMAVSSLSDTDWMHWCLTWSAAADAVFLYKDGVQVGTSTTLGVWALALSTGRSAIGDFRSTAPARPWSGWLAHAAIWNTVLTPTQVLDLSSV